MCYNRRYCSTSNRSRCNYYHVQNNLIYVTLTSASVFSLPYLLYIIVDLGYDDKKLYKYNKKVLGIDLICPVRRYKSNPKKRLEIICFYQLTLGQVIYNQRRILIEHIKSVFRIELLSARGFHKVSAIVLLSVLLYQPMVY